MKVSVLGPIQARCAGTPVELGPTRRRATLAALVVDANRTVSQDVLLDRVWDGAPPDSANTSLHAYVSRLRSAIRTAYGSAQAGEHIVTEPPGYRLVLDEGATDAEAFALAVRDARQAWAGGDAERASVLARGGLALWRGDTAYADLPAQFALEEADRLSQLRRAGEQLAVDADLALGRHAELVDEIRLLLRSAPFSEGLHAGLMLALYRTGHQADALAHYATARTLLADELGVDPGRELQDLQARILNADESLAAPAVQAAVSVSAEHADAALVVDAYPLIGREDELARICAEVTSGWRDAARTIVVTGEAGIGKTRLLEQAASRLADPEVALGWGRCWQHEGSPRLWPWVQVLRALAESVGAEEFARAAEGVSGVLGGVVPELLPGSNAPTVVADVESSELRLLDAITLLLRRLAARYRLLVLLEDMHWADPTSRRMLEYALRYLVEPGVALVVSVRWPSDEATASTSALLAGLSRGARASRVDLDGFDAGDVRDFVASRTGSDIDPATGAALLERTDGNPFFLGELVRLIVTDSADAPVMTDEVPDSVRAVVLARLDHVAADQRAVLDAAAVVGRTFDLGLLQAASAVDEDTVDEAVDAATATGTVVSEPARPGEHRFAHALVQQTLLEAIGPSRRRRLHLRIADELRRRAGDGGVPRDAAALVHHLTSAGSDDALQSAVGVCLAQSADARRRGDIAAAEAALLQGLDAVSRMRGANATQTELGARLQLLSLYTLLSPTSDAARAERERVVGLARDIGDSTELLVALQGVLADGALRGDLGLMDAVADELATAGAERSDALLCAAASLARAHVLFHRGRFADAVSAADDAIARFDSLAVPFGAFPLEPRRVARAWRAFAFSASGEHDLCDAQLAELAPLLRPPYPDSHSVLYVNVILGLLEASRDDPVAAADRVAAARAELGRLGALGDGLPYLDVVDAWTRERVSPGTGLREIRAALDTVAWRPTMSQRPLLKALLADVLIRAGAVDEATTVLADARAETTVMGEHWCDAILDRTTRTASASV